MHPWPSSRVKWETLSWHFFVATRDAIFPPCLTPSADWPSASAVTLVPGTEHQRECGVQHWHILVLLPITSESPKVVLRNQHKLDLLSLNTFYAVEGKVNSNPFLMTKPLVPYKDMFWSSSWLGIHIASRISGIFPQFLQRNKTKKLRWLKQWTRSFSCVIQKMKLSSKTSIRLHNSDTLAWIIFNELQLHYNYITITLIVL